MSLKLSNEEIELLYDQIDMSRNTQNTNIPLNCNRKSTLTDTIKETDHSMNIKDEICDYIIDNSLNTTKNEAAKIKQKKRFNTNLFLSSDLFLEEMPYGNLRDYSCNICEGICYENEIDFCKPEGHLYCDLCLKQLKEKSSPPMCIISKEPILNHSKISIIKNQIGRYRVKCTNYTKDCNYSGTVEDYITNHLAICDKATKECKYACGFLAFKKDIPNHEINCSLRMINCSNCKEKIQFCNKENHDTKECIERLVSCDLCAIRVEFKRLDQHKMACPNVPIRCPYYSFGCYKICRHSTLNEHLLEDLYFHSKIQNMLNFQKNKDITDKITLMERKNEELSHEIKIISSKLKKLNDNKTTILDRLNKPKNRKRKESLNKLIEIFEHNYGSENNFSKITKITKTRQNSIDEKENEDNYNNIFLELNSDANMKIKNTRIKKEIKKEVDSEEKSNKSNIDTENKKIITKNEVNNVISQKHMNNIEENNIKDYSDNTRTNNNNIHFSNDIYKYNPHPPRKLKNKTNRPKKYKTKKNKNILYRKIDKKMEINRIESMNEKNIKNKSNFSIKYEDMFNDNLDNINNITTYNKFKALHEINIDKLLFSFHKKVIQNEIKIIGKWKMNIQAYDKNEFLGIGVCNSKKVNSNNLTYLSNTINVVSFIKRQMYLISDIGYQRSDTFLTDLKEGDNIYFTIENVKKKELEHDSIEEFNLDPKNIFKVDKYTSYTYKIYFEINNSLTKRGVFYVKSKYDYSPIILCGPNTTVNFEVIHERNK